MRGAGDPINKQFLILSPHPRQLLLRRLKRLLLVLYLLHGPGQSLDRFPVSPSPCSRSLLGKCSMLRLKRLLLVPYRLRGPGQSLDRFPVSPSPCSRSLLPEGEGILL